MATRSRSAVSTVSSRTGPISTSTRASCSASSRLRASSTSDSGPGSTSTIAPRAVLFSGDLDREVGSSLFGASAYYLRDRGGYSYGDFGGPPNVGGVDRSWDLWLGARGHHTLGRLKPSYFFIWNRGKTEALDLGAYGLGRKRKPGLRDGTNAVPAPDVVLDGQRPLLARRLGGVSHDRAERSRRLRRSRLLKLIGPQFSPWPVGCERSRCEYSKSGPGLDHAPVCYPPAFE